MTDQLTSLAARLREAKSPYEVRKWTEKTGYYVATCCISQDDVPQLIELVVKWNDPDWPENAPELGIDWEDAGQLPITAWRSLADLEADDAVEPLIDLLVELDDADDWMLTEWPHVFGKIGAPAVPVLDQLANDIEQPEFARSMVAEALHRVALYHPETRDDVVARLMKMMANAQENPIDFNSSVLGGLVELRVSEAAEAIERAFAADRLDVGFLGDWEYVRRKLGVEGLRLEMPKHPCNSMEEFHRRVGIGIFSEEPLIDFSSGDLTDAVDDYFEQAGSAFSKSKEAEQVLERCGDLGWYGSLLDFGVQYRGEIVDEMTLSSVRNYVLDYVPRKASIETDQVACLVFELTKFWEFLDRVFELPNAQAIIAWLKSDGLVAELEAKLSDPANFGMAKSLFMAGKAAGYDMTSEKGINQFMLAYNQSLLQAQHEPPPTPTSRPISETKRQRIGRNDPCPCGSGKKYKKCCLKC